MLLPCLAALEELTGNYGATVVLCTATQPAVRVRDGALRERFRPVDHGLPIGADRELAPRPERLADEVRRVTVEVLPEPIGDEVVAARFEAQKQMLCIVNSRAHARALFARIRGLPGAFYLTTLMCPAHRRAVLAEIKARLEDGRPVRLVATSLVEAGIDFSFPEVWRAEAGLDQIAQAAGRCNRNGELHPALGRVVVFTPAAHRPPRSLAAFQQAARPVLRDHPDPLGPDAIAAYFRLLYAERGLAELDAAEIDGQAGILAAFGRHGLERGFPFESVARAFRLIDEAMVPVVVPWDAEAVQALAEVAGMERPTGEALRRLHPYTVGIPRQVHAGWCATREIVPVSPACGEVLTRFATMDLYDATIGIDLWATAARDGEADAP
ncbi:CRISPR-associated helicase/endonuclease Cas3 [Methylobacterium sp. WSM2598]|uniref:CRISPR-associated helicase/endonuclease Cas3 n=1 Tax=Methylobacterium sp. WSM2598 TaxID=398261 RepID=UPI0003A0B075|nr:hypothetical protein [Methylobacterium sp. WSM2598]